MKNMPGESKKLAGTSVDRPEMIDRIFIKNHPANAGWFPN
jgi:hypothetical protein